MALSPCGLSRFSQLFSNQPNPSTAEDAEDAEKKGKVSDLTVSSNRKAHSGSVASESAEWPMGRGR
jgi:hypothetical protein